MKYDSIEYSSWNELTVSTKHFVRYDLVKVHYAHSIPMYWIYDTENNDKVVYETEIYRNALSYIREMNILNKFFDVRS